MNDAGYTHPSPVQWSTLPLANIGVDLVIQAKSGTGKTLVFVLSTLNMINLDLNTVQVILITPTREIAVQGARALLDVAKEYEELKVHTFIGGMSVSDDIIKCKKCHVAVGTPGRLRQLMEAGHIKMEAVRLFVLDEADKLMEDSFKPDLTWIFNKLPKHKQVIALSATYPEALETMVSKFMSNPKLVKLSPKSNVLLGVSQFVIGSEADPRPNVELDKKFKILLEILNKISFSQCLIFSNFSIRAEAICDKLEANGWPVEFLAGTMDQRDRIKSLNSLKAFNCRVLLTTDLSARGIDAANVNLVVNLEVPWDHNTYLHRVGRCGRFGSQGIAITIASQGKELNSLKEISFLSKSQIYQLKVTPSEVVIPDLWRLKQDGKLEETLNELEILEEKEPQIKDDQPSIFDILKKSKKNKLKNNPQVKQNDHVDEQTEEFIEETDYYAQEDNQYEYNEDPQDYHDYNNQWVPVETEPVLEPDLNQWVPVTNDFEQDIIEESDDEQLLNDKFLMSSFEQAIGRSLDITKPTESSKSNQEFKDLLYKLHDTSKEPKESDIKQFNEIANQLVQERRQKRSKRLQKCEEVLNSDVKVAIEDLMNGLVIKDDDQAEELVQAELVIKTEMISNDEHFEEPEKVVLFDLDSGGLKVELDYEYGDPDGYLDHGQDQQQQSEKQEEQLEEDYNLTQVWNPFPDPDLGLPEDLYTLHANEWLRMQYQLWLDKVSLNKAMIEKYYFHE